jgi:hypothetical protein
MTFKVMDESPRLPFASSMALRIILILLALLNLVPGIVALWPERSVALYSQTLDTPTLALLIRHRAVLLACVGAALGWAALDSRLVWPALVFAATSKLSFLAIGTEIGWPPPLIRIAQADGVALVLGSIAALLHRLS